MPEGVDEGKIRDRVAALEKTNKELRDAVAYLLNGAKSVNAEIDDNWGERPYSRSEHLGIQIS